MKDREPTQKLHAVLPVSLVERLDEIAVEQFEGNRSLALRALIRERVASRGQNLQVNAMPATTVILSSSLHPVEDGPPLEPSGPAGRTRSSEGCAHVIDGLKCTRCHRTVAQIKAQP